MSLLSRYPVLQSLFHELSALHQPPAVKPSLSSEGRDWHRVEWPGLGRFWLTGPQHRVVLVLVEALFESRCPDVPQKVLISAARVRARRLAEVFGDSSAWGTLVLPGEEPGTYRLAGLPEGPRAA